MKTAVVMGASGGIGEAIVRSLAKEGYSVVCHYHSNQKKVLNLVEELAVTYPQQDFFMVPLDMLAEEEIPNFISQLFQADALVFASGFSYYKLFSEMTSIQMNNLWQIHLKTPMLLCQQLLGKLSKNHQGRIIFIGSVYGQMGSSMEAVYSCVKGGQEAFCKSYAKEIASLGVTVNVVAPGAVNTAMNANWAPNERRELEEEIPVGRLADAEEIASVVKFLVSSLASYVTGTTFAVNGGWY
ncbi:MAG: SDR family oxidoreductase [Lactobacillales bacterium]|jgi:3-oxoacyl-[acyl-carrier protein] reductase|nr:SDR family oxidoreductase [Lactobacillales bacterium]